MNKLIVSWLSRPSFGKTSLPERCGWFMITIDNQSRCVKMVREYRWIEIGLAKRKKPSSSSVHIANHALKRKKALFPVQSFMCGLELGYKGLTGYFYFGIKILNQNLILPCSLCIKKLKALFTISIRKNRLARKQLSGITMALSLAHKISGRSRGDPIPGCHRSPLSV